jgi:RNA-directed DNA polymerase
MGKSYQPEQRRRKGLANYCLVRYADDWVVLVAGTRADADALREEARAVLAPMGLRMSEEKTRISHIDEGFDFLGYRIRRDQKRGGGKRYVYTYPSKAALAAIKAKVRTISQQGRNLPLNVLLHRLNPVLRGWAYHFRYGVSSTSSGSSWGRSWRR